MDQKEQQDSIRIAGHIYHARDYHKNDLVSTGLAITHEQFSDAYMEGEIGTVIGDINCKDIPIPRKGFSEED